MGRGMEMDGCGKFVKTLMFFSNFVIWIGSIILIVLGIWAVVDRPYLEKVLGETVYISSAYILIAVGVLAFIISFLGCFGAIKEIKCMLLMYFIFVLLLFIILLVGGILGFVFHGEAEEKIKMGMLQSMKEYKVGEKDPITTSWDETQRAMKCCGIELARDWPRNNAGFKGSKKVPDSCCLKNPDTGKYYDCASGPNESNSYTTGCFFASQKFVKAHAKYIGGAGIAVAVLMLFGMIFALTLFKLIN